MSIIADYNDGGAHEKWADIERELQVNALPLASFSEAEQSVVRDAAYEGRRSDVRGVRFESEEFTLLGGVDTEQYGVEPSFWLVSLTEIEGEEFLRTSAGYFQVFSNPQFVNGDLVEVTEQAERPNFWVWLLTPVRRLGDWDGVSFLTYMRAVLNQMRAVEGAGEGEEMSSVRADGAPDLSSIMRRAQDYSAELLA